MKKPGSANDFEELPALFAGGTWDTVLDGNIRTLVERDCLIPFLRRQRWFAGKARHLKQATIGDWTLVRRGHEPMFLTFVEAAYDDGGRETYFIPMVLRDAQQAAPLLSTFPRALIARITGARKGILIDALVDDDCCDELLAAIAGERELATRLASVGAFRTSALELPPGRTHLKVRRGPAEQSNTSVIFGDHYIMKLFRRLEPGPNPDVEIGRYLTERAHFSRVPGLAGGLEYRMCEEGLCHAAMLQRLVPSQANGWEHAIGEIGRFFERTHARPVPIDVLQRSATGIFQLAEDTLPQVVLDTVGGYLESAGKLGRRTAELHVALAQPTDDPAIAPATITAGDLHRLADAMQANVRVALAMLEAGLGHLPAPVRTQAEQVLAGTGSLLGRIEAVRGLDPGFAKTRVHGDYHLGQVLWAEGDFVILDFEGEPSRPLEERREKQSPLKDIAGMLRSLSYAANAGLFEATATSQSQFDRVEAWAHIWQRYCAAVFLRTYLSAAQGADFLPADPAALESLLEAYVLDKAFYELRYELNNRPDWVRIPLWGILESAELGSSRT